MFRLSHQVTLVLDYSEKSSFEGGLLEFLGDLDTVAFPGFLKKAVALNLQKTVFVSAKEWQRDDSIYPEQLFSFHGLGDEDQDCLLQYTLKDFLPSELGGNAITEFLDLRTIVLEGLVEIELQKKSST